VPRVLEKFPLKDLNTFGVEAYARWFTEIKTEDDLAELFADERWKDIPKLVLGGGSNILITKDFDGLVIKIGIHGLENEVAGEKVNITAGAGEIWNDLVIYSVERGFAGIENLSLIPGSVGAAPIQNIGAYGVELKDVFLHCRAFEIATGMVRHFNNEDCKFSYRDSIFKNTLKGKYIITGVAFELSTIPNLHTEYGAIKQELGNRGIDQPTIKDISEAVSYIRVSKLPDPSTIGNAGSFFKNPVITVDKFRHLQSAFPDIVYFPEKNGMQKISAGWMIEKCGWKGRIVGETGTWKNQALVIVNHGKATGSDIYDLSSSIISDVKKHFDITLEREVNVI